MGGIAMEVGVALLVAAQHDPRNGRAVVRNLADYHVSSMADTPTIRVEWLYIPYPVSANWMHVALGKLVALAPTRP